MGAGVRFRYGSVRLTALNLATTMQSLARFSKRTTRRCCLTALWRRARLSPCGFRLFSVPVKASFQRSITVLCTIGLEECLDLDAIGTHLPPAFPSERTRRRAILRESSTGLSPSEVRRSRRLRLTRED